mgnify:CR=1 FL=1
MRSSPSGRSNERAVSEILGYILIFSLIVATVALVSISGLPALDSARESEQIQNAERAFDVLNSNMAEVYKRGSPSRATELSAGDARVEIREPVIFNVSVENADGNVTSEEAEIAPIVFSGRGETEFVYEAGAVIREQRDSSIMLRDPPIKLDDERLFFTIVETFSDSQQSASGGSVLVRATSTDRNIVLAEVIDSTSEQVNITVSNTDRGDAWSQFFETELGMDCTRRGGLDCGTEIDVDQTYVTVQTMRVTLET